MTDQSVINDYLKDALSSFRAYKKLADKAIEQVQDHELFIALDEESNSIAVVMKHMAGNMFSRWTDFLTTDGEKPDRNRDCEFVDPPPTRIALMDLWERGWQCLFRTLKSLT